MIFIRIREQNKFLIKFYNNKKVFLIFLHKNNGFSVYFYTYFYIKSIFILIFFVSIFFGFLINIEKIYPLNFFIFIKII